MFQVIIDSRVLHNSGIPYASYSFRVRIRIQVSIRIRIRVRVRIRVREKVRVRVRVVLGKDAIQIDLSSNAIYSGLNHYKATAHLKFGFISEFNGSQLAKMKKSIPDMSLP